MKKKVISGLLVAAMTATMLAGCGSTTTTTTTTTDAAADTTAAEPAAETEAAEETAASEEGTVLNICEWNTEFQTRVEACYPGYEKVDDTTGKIGDVTVNWLVTPTDDNAYQNDLDTRLTGQEAAAADDKVDLFLVEADYAIKYTDTDYTMSMADLGLDDSVFADQFQYTKDVVTDSNGNLKGSSWQGCPGALIYRRDIAKDVLGTDDPAEVQKAVSDWDTFLATADSMKAKGYQMTSSVNDSYRVFSNNVTSKWVEDGALNIDENIQKWVDMSKAMVDAGETNTYDLWGDDWSKGFYMDSNVFCYFGPAWFINFSMSCDQEGSVGAASDWAITEGPQGFYWGGTWMCAATGTDNPTLVADLIKTMTTDEDVLSQIVTDYQDFTNDQSVMDGFASDDSFGIEYLGGQNPYGIFASGVSTVDLSNISAYDQGCNEEFQTAMKNYFDGNATYDEALAQFKTAISEKYPDITVE